MESDINEAKSRTFNLLLRFFQLGLCLSATFFIGDVFHVTCLHESFKIIKVLGIMMTAANLCGMLFIAYRKRHSKPAFMLFYISNLIICVIIMVFSAINYSQSPQKKCPTKTLFYMYYLTNIPLYIILSLMILFLPFYWVQRVTNSPGSAVWPFLFFIFCHFTRYQVLLEVIGFIALITNILTWASNGLALLYGVSTAIKKAIIVCFFIGIGFTAVNEILTLIAAFSVPSIDYERVFVKSMLETYLFVNGIDLVFWLIGMMSLNHENGDVVRDGLLQYGVKADAEPEQVQDQGEFDVNYGSIQ